MESLPRRSSGGATLSAGQKPINQSNPTKKGSIMESVLEVLMRRDGLSRQEGLQLICEARRRVYAGEDPEEVLAEEFGLEPDYLFDIL